MVFEFTTILGLISQFRSERSNQSQADFNEFIEWLVTVNHVEQKKLLEQNIDSTVYIKALLNKDHKTFQEQLNKIEAVTTSFASTLEGFGELAQEINPKAILSEQAIDILRQFEYSGATKIITVYMGLNSSSAQYQYKYSDAEGELRISEPRFIEDDLQTLVNLDLLRHDLNASGSNLYIFTRAASNLIKECNS